MNGPLLARSVPGGRLPTEGRGELLLRAAMDLLLETGGPDVTVQQVLERTGLSLRAFYQHFAGKDELLLAVLAEAVAGYVEQVRDRLAAIADPLDRLHAYVADFFATVTASASDAAGDGHLLSRALTLVHLRLAADRPELVASALEPQLRLAEELLAAGARTGQVRRDVEPRQLAAILTETLVAMGHSGVLRTTLHGGAPFGAEQLWAFCLGGVAGDRRPSAAPVDRVGTAGGRTRRTVRSGTRTRGA